jgi:hypothetical protein
MKLIVAIMYTRTIKPVSTKADTVTWKCPDEIGLYVILRLGFNELVYKIEAESRSTASRDYGWRTDFVCTLEFKRPAERAPVFCCKMVVA